MVYRRKKYCGLIAPAGIDDDAVLHLDTPLFGAPTGTILTGCPSSRHTVSVGLEPIDRTHRTS